MKIKKIIPILELGLLMGMTGCQKADGGPLKPSEVTFEGVYKQEGMDNVEFQMSEDSSLQMNQKGIYMLTEDESQGTVLRICFDDISRELPEDYSYMDYRVAEKGEHLELTYIASDETVVIEPVELVFQKGKDGLLGKENFKGTYQIGTGGDSFYYIFEKDGTINMQVKQHYYADDSTITLYDSQGSTEYLYQQEEGTFVLKNKQGDIIFELVKQKN